MPDDFPDQLMELLAFLHHGFRPDHPFSRIELSPEMPGAPEVWLLGSSLWSAAAAAQVGLPYAFAHFIDPRPTRSAIEYYRSHFVPSDGLDTPRTIVAVGAICADAEDEAQRLLMSARLLRRRIRQGDLRPIPSVEEAIREMGPPSAPSGPSTGEWPRIFAGNPEQIHGRLVDMASVLHTEELMVVTIVHDHRARMRSYELLAEAFDLAPRRGERPAQPA